MNSLLGKKDDSLDPPELSGGCEELLKHYIFLSKQRNEARYIDFNAVCRYAEIYPVGDTKLFTEIIFAVDEAVRKEVKDA